MVKRRDVFDPQWPEGLEHGKAYQVDCDDKGRLGGSYLRVAISQDGDVHLLMQEWEEMPEGMPNPLPTLR